MTRTDFEPIPATAGDAEQISELIAAAFHSLAPCQWLIAHPIQRRETLPAYFRILVDHTLAHGTIDTDPQRTAAALWLPVGAHGPTVPDDYDARLKQAVGSHLERYEILDEQFEAHHPTGVAHQHLAILAVHPDHQRQGLGRALLAHRHRQFDAAGTPAYLEASDATNRAWYLRHGYADHGDEPIRLPQGPDMYPLWRAPQTG